MQYLEAKDIEALLVEAEKLASDASRQVRRAAVANARKVLGTREWEHDAAKRALGWKPETERVRASRRGVGAAAAALGMMVAMGRVR